MPHRNTAKIRTGIHENVRADHKERKKKNLNYDLTEQKKKQYNTTDQKIRVS